MSASRNQRLAWLSSQLAECKSTPTIVKECMVKFPNVSEKTIRTELKGLLQRMMDIELENLPEVKARMMEIAFKLLEECRSLAQMGPAVNQFKMIAQMSGLLSEKGPESSSTSNTGSPESQVIRDRIKQLMKKKSIRDQAKEAGIDLDELAKEDGEE